MSDLISRGDAIKAVLASNLSACTVFGRSEEGMATAKELIQVIKNLPSAQQGLSFEKIAALLANMFDDECACNFNDIDEWLPMSCKYSETACPHPDEPHGCWLQFLLHGGADMRGEEHE